MFSLLIKNATIYDGLGGKPYKADLGIKDGKISSISESINSKAQVVLDASNLVLTPGFIDMQNHSDSYWRLLENPDLDSSVLQGFTTILVGNCGASLAPLLSRQALLSVRKWHDVSGSNVSWQTFEEYVQAVSARGLGINVGSLIGLSTLRRGALGDEVRNLTDAELKMLGSVFEKSLSEGAFGLSSGLSYSHELNISDTELEYMLSIVKEKDGLFSVHLRNEAANIVESVEHVVRLAEKSKVRLKISHLKVRGEKHWHLLDQVLQILENSYHKGNNVYFDIYPYDTLWQPLYSYLPKWSVVGGRSGLLKQLADKTQRKKILEELHLHHTKFEELILSSTANKLTTTGKKLSSIASSHGMSSEETVLELIEKGGSEVLVFDKCLDQEQIWRLTTHPLSAIATDGSGFELNSKNLVHPRCFGTTAKFLRYILDTNKDDFAFGVQKLTSLPAKMLQLKDRGVIKEKSFADLCLLDLETLRDNATLSSPNVPSSGIQYVFCAGQPVVADGKLTRLKAGRFLKA